MKQFVTKGYLIFCSCKFEISYLDEQEIYNSGAILTHMNFGDSALG